MDSALSSLSGSGFRPRPCTLDLSQVRASAWVPFNSSVRSDYTWDPILSNGVRFDWKQGREVMGQRQRDTGERSFHYQDFKKEIGAYWEKKGRSLQFMIGMVGIKCFSWITFCWYDEILCNLKR